MPQQSQPPKKNPPPRDLRMGVGQVFPTFTPEYEGLRTPLDPTPLAVTNPVLAQALDFLGGLTGFKDALVPTSSGATVAGAGLGAMLPLAALGSLKKLGTAAKMAEATPTPIRAYHGSPHDFDQFSLSKIGTGEGAQAYGHGLYFAENPAVAADYRKSLSAPSADNPAFRWKGEPVAPGTPHYRIANWLETPKAGESTADMLKRRIGDLEKQAEFAAKVYGEDSASMYRSAIADLKRIDPKELSFHQPGRTYEVALHASPDEFLDWDKPLSQQSEKAKQAVKALIPSEFDRFDNPALTAALTGKHPAGSAYDPSWRDVMTDLSSALGRHLTDAEMSTMLKSKGIKGIRYADAGSRGTKYGELQDIYQEGGKWRAKILVKDRATAWQNAPTDTHTWSPKFDTRAQAEQWANDKIHGGTSNYVVFDDAIIAIMKKYGVGITTAGAILENQRRQEQAKNGGRR